jgi:hypothetical protein
MHTPTQLVRTGAHSAPAAGARRPRECRTYRRPQVRELPLRLEPVAPETFGGLVNNRSTPALRAVLTTTTHLRGAHA